MTNAGRDMLVVALLLCTALLMVRAVRAPPPLGPPRVADPCAVPVERAGEGVTCLDEEAARTEGLHAGDRVLADGTRIRMAPSRIALFAVPVDLNAASLEELESLP